MPQQQQKRLSTREIQRRKKKEYAKNKARLSFSNKNKSFIDSSPLFDIKSDLHEINVSKSSVDRSSELRTNLSLLREKASEQIANNANASILNSLTQNTSSNISLAGEIKKNNDAFQNTILSDFVNRSNAAAAMDSQIAARNAAMGKNINDAAAASLLAGQSIDSAAEARANALSGQTAGKTIASGENTGTFIAGVAGNSNTSNLENNTDFLKNMGARASTNISQRVSDSALSDSEIARQQTLMALALDRAHDQRIVDINTAANEAIDKFGTDMAKIAKDLSEADRAAFDNMLAAMTADELKQLEKLNLSAADVLAKMKDMQQKTLEDIAASRAELNAAAAAHSAALAAGFTAANTDLGKVAGLIAANAQALKGMDPAGFHANFGKLVNDVIRFNPGLAQFKTDVYVCTRCGGTSGVNTDFMKIALVSTPNRKYFPKDKPFVACICAAEQYHTSPALPMPPGPSFYVEPIILNDDALSMLADAGFYLARVDYGQNPYNKDDYSAGGCKKHSGVGSGRTPLQDSDSFPHKNMLKLIRKADIGGGAKSGALQYAAAKAVLTAITAKQGTAGYTG